VELVAALRIGVVAPTLNEEATLPAMLESLRRQTRVPDEIVIADGGSSDATHKIGASYSAIVVHPPRRGRGCQIAYAIERLNTDVVMVAHADMVFPANALAAVEKLMMTDPTCPGGCLGHRFDRRRLCYRVVEFMDYNRACRRRISFGDQAQFFRRELIASAGGFPDQPIMEDLELSLRLRTLGRPAYLGIPVTVSARYLDRNGYLRTIWRNVVLRWVYRRKGLGACQHIYERYYGSNGGLT
jgi:glycosyltransferase involved in cell wall biosynthesis